MITDPEAARVLCFGDSNTYGTCRRGPGVIGTHTPDPDYVRLDADLRWPGVLQRVLGTGFEVIEEGLNGRTTDLDDPGRRGLDGRAYFVPCLMSHCPLDVVVIMLGGNDLKPGYGRTPEETALALGRYVDDIAELATDRTGGVPVTLLVGPMNVDDTAPQYRDLVGDNLDPRHAARSRQLAEEIRKLATQRGVAYADASEVANPGEDGMHLDSTSHLRLGEFLATMILRESSATSIS